MKRAIALLLFAAVPALAQVTSPPPAVPSKEAATCPDCGVVRSIRSIQKEARPVPADSTKPSGLVATIPLGSSGAKHGAKPQVGSSSDLGRDVVPEASTWEVIVRLDDGRFRVVVLDESPNLRVGDKVKVEDGKVVLR